MLIELRSIGGNMIGYAKKGKKERFSGRDNGGVLKLRFLL